MSNPYGINRLPYPLNYRTLLVQGAEYNADAINPVPDDCSWYVIQLTNEQRLKMTSAILAGMDQIYPDEFVDLFQLWLQATNYPNTFPPHNGNGCSPVDLCQLILDCINTTPAIQQAIGQYSLTSAITEITPEQQIILDTDLFDSQAPCNNDQIYGMTLQLTDFLNAVSEDILELFVTAFAAPGRLGDIIEAIPVIGSLPGDDILQILEKLATQINDAYQAGYDTQIREDISCDLFCISQADCVLTLEEARNYFKDKLTVAVTDTDFLSVANDIIANNWLGEQSIYVMHWLILDTIIFGGEMLGIDVNRMVTTISSFYNDPNPDWATLCVNCSWTSVLDLTVSDYGFVFGTGQLGNPAGVWTDGIGIVGSEYQGDGDARIGCFGSWDIDESTITSFRMEGSITRGSHSGYTLATIQQLKNNAVVEQQKTTPFTAYPVGVPTNFNILLGGFSETIDEIFAFILASGKATNGACVMTKVTIQGTGAKPPQLP